VDRLPNCKSCVKCTFLIYALVPYTCSDLSSRLIGEQTTNSGSAVPSRICDSRIVPVRLSARFQASLRDAVTFLAGYPALETPGYFQMSLRDRGFARVTVGFRATSGFEQVPGFFVGFVFLGVAVFLGFRRTSRLKPLFKQAPIRSARSAAPPKSCRPTG
jgi:hypothetical protein